MSTDDKVRENRLRRMAERQGLILQRSRRRDPRATEYGMYRLLDAETGAPASVGDTFRLSLDEIEETLTTDRDARRRAGGEPKRLWSAGKTGTRPGTAP
jgi:hypothetical protein